MRADGVALAADAEELALDRVEVQRRADRLLEDGVERLGQALARADAIDRRVLHAVGNPQVRDAGLAERLAHGGADAPAGDAVIDPERPDGLVSVRERDVVGRLRVREVRRVEVEADAECLRPVDPAGEVLGSDLVAIDGLAAELAVRGVEVEAVRSGNDRERERRVGAQLVGRARLSWIVAGRGEAAAETGAELLEPARHRRPASSAARWAPSRGASAPRRYPPRLRRSDPWQPCRRCRSERSSPLPFSRSACPHDRRPGDYTRHRAVRATGISVVADRCGAKVAAANRE